jgi:hypothetical protein
MDHLDLEEPTRDENFRQPDASTVIEGVPVNHDG